MPSGSHSVHKVINCVFFNSKWWISRVFPEAEFGGFFVCFPFIFYGKTSLSFPCRDLVSRVSVWCKSVAVWYQGSCELNPKASFCTFEAHSASPCRPGAPWEHPGSFQNRFLWRNPWNFGLMGLNPVSARAEWGVWCLLWHSSVRATHCRIGMENP